MLLHACWCILFVMIVLKTKCLLLKISFGNLVWKRKKKKSRILLSPLPPFRPVGPDSPPPTFPSSWAAAQPTLPPSPSLPLVADGWGPPVRTISFPKPPAPISSLSVGNRPGRSPAPTIYPFSPASRLSSGERPRPKPLLPSHFLLLALSQLA